MPEERINLPDMGEGVEEATVAAILVHPGDPIQVDQGIIELETDKAVAEVPSPKAGKVKEVHVAENQQIEQGQALLTIETEGGGDGRKGQPKQESAKQPQAEEKPKAKDKPQGETSETPKPRPKGQDQPEQDQGEQESAEQRQKPAAKAGGPTPGPQSAAQATGSGDATVPAGPATRRLARELGVDLRSVEGSGPEGWITEADVKSAAQSVTDGRPHDKWGPIRREKMRAIRKTVSQKMAESHLATAATTHFDDADVTELDDFRKQTQAQLPEGDVKLSLLPFAVRAVVNALKAHPIVNASLDHGRDEIVYKEYVHVGIAVDTDRGLIVPVLRNADSLSVIDTARKIDELARKAREGSFEVADLRGGTFSVSNLGSIGGKYATPIINHPESAILLLGRGGPRPVVVDGAVQIRKMLPLSLTYDHRLIDGGEAARFLNDIVAQLQSPSRLLTG